MSPRPDGQTGNPHIYIHEFVDIRGHHRADYMHHMAANWSPLAQETRDQQCYGIWAVLGTTGAWPQVVNMWQEDGYDGLARSFAGEAVGPGAQDRTLARWWAAAVEFRRGGFDRLLEPAPWARTIEQLCADGVSGRCYAHEQIGVRPGADREFLQLAHDRDTEVYARFGWELAGGFSTAMVDDDECFLLWAIPQWADWAAAESARATDPAQQDWRRRSSELVTSRHRILLVDAPLCPFATGRQPHRDDRTDWVD